jgi:hypothetical protein
MAEGPQFNLKEYEESISHTFPEETLKQLNQILDFRRAFEINPELQGIFKEVGISGDFGSKGLMPSEWPEFGPVQKTLAEFKAAYDGFQYEMVTLIKKTRSIGKKKR